MAKFAELMKRPRLLSFLTRSPNRALFCVANRHNWLHNNCSCGIRGPDAYGAVLQVQKRLLIGAPVFVFLTDEGLILAARLRLRRRRVGPRIYCFHNMQPFVCAQPFDRPKSACGIPASVSSTQSKHQL